MVNNKLRLITVFWLLLQFAFPLSVYADTLVLRSGEKFKGTLANRQMVRSQPLLLKQISILIENSKSDIRTFEIVEIDFVIIEDGDEREVVDILGMLKQYNVIDSQEKEAPDLSDESSLGSGDRLLIGMVGVGLMVGGVLLDTGRSYDGGLSPINYILIGCGGFLMLWGFISAATSGNSNNISAGIGPGGEYCVSFETSF